MKRSSRVSMMGVAIALGAMAVIAEVVPPGTDDEIRARLRPVGELCRAGEPCAATAAVAGSEGTGLSGEAVYGKFCFACHEPPGVPDAPKMGDPEVWAERAAKGMDTLLASSIKGLNLMPPMGTCMDCSETEMQSAIQHMLDASL